MMTVNAGSNPPVVFISQIGTDGGSWQPVLERLTSGATTITYDRPGTGNCPPRPAPNPALPYSVFADELAALLDQQGVTQSAVVVGHSVGSLIARMFASRYPERVAGMVHVDGSIPRLSLWPVFTDLPSPDGDDPGATAFALAAGEAEILTAAPADVPTVVIARTPGRWPKLPSPPDADLLWGAYQCQLASQSFGQLVVAADAGHQVPAEAPRLVAQVVDCVVLAVRHSEPSGIGEAGWDPQRVEQAGGSLVRPPYIRRWLQPNGDQR